MGDVFLAFYRSTLPDELVAVLQDVLQATESGDFLKVFQLPEVQILLGHKDSDATQNVQRSHFDLWSDYIFQRLGLILSKRNEEQGTPTNETAAYRQHLFFIVAIAALCSFIQSTVTGPPLQFNSADVLLPKEISQNQTSAKSLREHLISSLSTDGVAAYRLTPDVELLCLAETILICPPIQKNIQLSAWARLRVNFAHQRLLSEPTSSLQTAIYEDLKIVEEQIRDAGSPAEQKNLRTNFWLERAAIHTHHGLDKQARADLDQSSAERNFEFALTGLMGKRTKFQQKDTSQLIVLAKSASTLR